MVSSHHPRVGIARRGWLRRGCGGSGASDPRPDQGVWMRSPWVGRAETLISVRK